MQQQNFFSSSAGSGPAVTHDDGVASPGNAPHPPAPSPIKRRPRRFVTVLLTAEFLLAIMVRIFIGVIVLVLPWSPLWDNNHLLQALPHVATLLSYGAVRGIFSGIGLLNLWVAVDDTLHRGERHI
jgi:hypothetical protein